MNETNETMTDVKVGDMFYFKKTRASTTGRPGIVISVKDDSLRVVFMSKNDAGDECTNVTIQLPTTSSVAQCDTIHCVEPDMIGDRIGTVTEQELKNIHKAIIAGLGLGTIEILCMYDLIDEEDEDDYEEELFDEEDSDDSNVEVQVQIATMRGERDAYKQMYEDLIARIIGK